MRKFLLDLLFPSFCLGCQKEGFYLCQDCKATLEIGEYMYCLCNKDPLRVSLQQGKCYRCKSKKLSGVFAALSYKERFLTRKLIYQFKYAPYLKDLAQALASILVEHLIVTKNNSNAIFNNALLMPIPLEKKRLKSRGYNQAEELAKELSTILKVPLVANNLVKIKKTFPQVELSAKERGINLKGAFFVKNAPELKGKKIFLIDDVYTTGSTMEECARVLREAGVKNIWGMVIAREG